LPPSFTINDFIDGFKKFKNNSTKHPEALESIMSDLKDFMKDAMENGGEAANLIIVHSNNRDPPSVMQQQQNDAKTCEAEAEEEVTGEASAEEEAAEEVEAEAAMKKLARSYKDNQFSDSDSDSS